MVLSQSVTRPNALEDFVLEELSGLQRGQSSRLYLCFLLNHLQFGETTGDATLATLFNFLPTLLPAVLVISRGISRCFLNLRFIGTSPLGIKVLGLHSGIGGVPFPAMRINTSYA
ncbi:uncharacterized protein ARMOST_18836 [Armillaria ostoyae]|uniref:Uncharacterized protein n=1 Tax=Armillaria ostoyae TaxID=47428 RepID=A0A284S2V5_ARMOS|nr:uncharacterized protein ARMOST_18836 [Armillaria ostoyae]